MLNFYKIDFLKSCNNNNLLLKQQVKLKKANSVWYKQ